MDNAGDGGGLRGDGEAAIAMDICAAREVDMAVGEAG